MSPAPLPDPEAIIYDGDVMFCRYCGAVATCVRSEPHDGYYVGPRYEIVSVLITVEPCGHARIKALT